MSSPENNHPVNDIEALAVAVFGELNETPLATITELKRPIVGANAAFDSLVSIFPETCSVYAPSDQPVTPTVRVRKPQRAAEPDWSNHAIDLTNVVDMVRRLRNAGINPYEK